MSFSSANFTNLRLSETYKSDDTSDEANRRREMRRKQQSTSFKIQTHNRTVAKNLLDEVLGKEFTQSKNKSSGIQPDIGQQQGLPAPARFKGKDVLNDGDEHKNLLDGDAQVRSAQDREIALKNERSNAEAVHQKSSEFVGANAEVNAEINADADVKQNAALQNKNLPSSPLSMMTTQLDKLKNQILLIDDKRHQSQMSSQELEQSAQQQASMATSLDFLEGYAEGVLKDEANREQFEQSCSDLRELLVHSELNFNAALANTHIKQLNLSPAHIQSEETNENKIHSAIATKLEHDERTQKLKEDNDIHYLEDGEIVSRLDDTNRTQRNRNAKRDKNNSEATLPLLVQRSV